LVVQRILERNRNKEGSDPNRRRRIRALAPSESYKDTLPIGCKALCSSTEDKQRALQPLGPSRWLRGTKKLSASRGPRPVAFANAANRMAQP